MSGKSTFDWTAFAMRPAAVMAAWALWCLVMLALLPLRGADPGGPDEYMRLLEVRDLLAGQSWFDVTQYRVDPPAGASMHWSRLVDLPLAAVAAVAGERAALVLVPLLYLLPALFALRAIMLRLGFGPFATALGLVLLPLMPLLPEMFMPGSIDHHTPQGVLGLATVALVLAGSRRAAAYGGVLAGAWVVVSLEGLPMIAAIAAVCGLLYWLHGDQRLGGFLAGLAAAAPLLALATRTTRDFALPYCDVVAPGHFLAFAAAAAVALIWPLLPRQESMAMRFAGLVAIAAVAAPLAWLGLGQCASNPFDQLDPLLQQYWYGYITEGLPIWRQQVSVAGMLAWTLVLVLAGWWLLRRTGAEGRRRELDTLAMIAVAACLASFWLMRGGVLAQLLAIPFAAALVAHFLPRARALTSALPRIAATLACFLLATPTFASSALKPLDPLFASETMRTGMAAPIDPRECDYDSLARVPAGLVFAPLDNGPEVLGRTDHTVVMASYHRNKERMRQVLAAYTGSVEEAHGIVLATQADYVMACAAEADLALYRTAADDDFANALVAGPVPSWLQPVDGFAEGPLYLYRVIR